jgi:hypothetical protein
MWLLMILMFIILLCICTTGPAIAGSCAGLGCSLANYLLCYYEDKY